MTIEQRVIDNRVFLLGLDKLYRDAMKGHERGELLSCARRVAGALGVGPANVPVEGYYTEEPELTEYFRLIRALQEVEGSAAPRVASLPEFRRLLQVVSSPIYGRPDSASRLLPTGRDALSQALEDLWPDWTVTALTAAAGEIANRSEEISLVGLAARVRDPVVLAATRESVVLYAMMVFGRELAVPRIEYVWKVDADLARLAGKFVDTFNALFAEHLPPPDPAQAARYWQASHDNQIEGRCVRLGLDDRVHPVRQYHWAIYRAPSGAFAVHEFWASDLWTTERYQARLWEDGRRPDL